MASNTPKAAPLLPTVVDPKAALQSPTAEKARGANRTTKAGAQKLQVLPDTPDPVTQSKILPREKEKPKDVEEAETESVSDGVTIEEEDVEVYQQIAQIPDGTARADALRLTKKSIKQLPRVTAYCTASSYNFTNLMKFMKARKIQYETDPRTFDEVIYTTYSYKNAPIRQSSSIRGSTTERMVPPVADLLGIGDLSVPNESTPGENNGRPNLKGKGRLISGAEDQTPEVFIFKYGVVVIWGMTEAEESRFLASMRRFEEERLPSADVEMEDLHFYYAAYSRIFNDVITLRKGSSYMTKLSLSHALAQSVKISLFEDRIARTIEQTKDVPEMIASTGTITMPHDDIMKHIGKVFLLRMQINRVGSMMDSPELFWRYPDLQPLYDAARVYLEINQRLEILNSRVDVLQDMLRLLKDSVTSRHSERLEQIVIALIGVEILLGVITICVDLFAPSLEGQSF